MPYLPTDIWKMVELDVSDISVLMLCDKQLNTVAKDAMNARTERFVKALERLTHSQVYDTNSAFHTYIGNIRDNVAIIIGKQNKCEVCPDPVFSIYLVIPADPATDLGINKAYCMVKTRSMDEFRSCFRDIDAERLTIIKTFLRHVNNMPSDRGTVNHVLYDPTCPDFTRFDQECWNTLATV